MCREDFVPWRLVSMNESLLLPCLERVRMLGGATRAPPRPNCHLRQVVSPLCLICTMKRRTGPPGPGWPARCCPLEANRRARWDYCSAIFLSLSPLVLSFPRGWGVQKTKTIRTLTHFIAHHQLHASFFHRAVSLTGSQSCLTKRLTLPTPRKASVQKIADRKERSGEDF